MPHIFNLSFTPLTPETVDLLGRSGIGRIATWDEASQLPYVPKFAGPDAVYAALTEAVAKLAIDKTDIVIVGGYPDVVYYLVCLIRQKSPETPVIFLIGQQGCKTTDGTPRHRIVGFREIVSDPKRTAPTLHYIRCD